MIEKIAGTVEKLKRFCLWILSQEPLEYERAPQLSGRKSFLRWLCAGEALEFEEPETESATQVSFISFLFSPEPLAPPCPEETLDQEQKAPMAQSVSFLRWLLAFESLESLPKSMPEKKDTGFLRWLWRAEALSEDTAPPSSQPSSSFLRWLIRGENLGREPSPSRSPSFIRFLVQSDSLEQDEKSHSWKPEEGVEE